MTLRTNNGGWASVGTEFDYSNTTRAERAAVLEREARVSAWRKTLPKRKKPTHEKAGPVIWVSL